MLACLRSEPGHFWPTATKNLLTAGPEDARHSLEDISPKQMEPFMVLLSDVMCLYVQP